MKFVQNEDIIVNSEDNKEHISLVAAALCLYFILLPFDCLNIGGTASLLRIYAVVPLGCLFLSGGGFLLYVNQITKYLVLFLLIIVLSIFYSIDFSITLSSAISIGSNILLIILVASCYRFNERETNWLINSLVLSGWVMAICYLFFSDFMSNGRLLLSFGTDSTQDPNYANGYMLVAFSFHIYKVIEERKFKHIPLAIALFFIVILTGSRGALIAYLGCMILAFFCGLRDSEYRLRIISIAIVLAVLFYVGFTYFLSFADASLSERFSIEFLLEKGTTGRTDIWINLLGHYRDANIFRQIFGHGYGVSYLLNTTTASSTAGLVAHNVYIDDLMNVGLLGAVVRILMQIECGKCLYRNKKYALFSAFGAMIIMCMSLNLINYKPIWAMMMISIIIDNKETEYINS